MKTNRTMTAKERINSAYGLTAQNPVKPKNIVWYVLQQAIDEVRHQFVYCDTDSVYYLDYIAKNRGMRIDK